MLFYLTDELTRLAVINDRTAGHFDNLILAILTERTTLSTLTAISGHDMLLILEVKQSPEIPIAT